MKFFMMFYLFAFSYVPTFIMALQSPLVVNKGMVWFLGILALVFAYFTLKPLTNDKIKS